ncbi:DUF7146 domain-containing protein [Aestuariivirga litoralis]|uniref:DUF7146 domain-containing protein n=1 Tax=Aestuariivirga litoralis TaxID=2650924 RepID=UPI0018C6CAC4|nr:primase-helicase zinc-binding domain-containing protein [Aestuariivirga litoralis]MBG1232987.1 DNA primase [Aestuariivirga litoralis]
MRQDPAMEDWVNEARRADIWAALCHISPGHSAKLRGQRAVGPCPACGGTDRFSVDRKKGLFFCRRSAKGGDVIAMVEYLTGADFLGACETINGTKPPRGESGRKVDSELLAQREQLRAREAETRAREDNEFRTREIARAHAIWKGGAALPGSIAESYLRFRGVQPAIGAKIRSYEKLPYWHCLSGEWRVIHEGPAMVGAIQGPDGRFAGCHITYIDGSFTSPSGKAQIVQPQTGEILDAKKVRGSPKGGHIHLGGPEAPREIYIGEGIETVYSVRQALRGEDLGATAFWSSINLGNIGGRAEDRLVHPTRTRVDKNGRVSRVKVPGIIPACEERLLLPPVSADAVVILGDGDSDPFETHNTMQRAATRWARAGRVVKVAWAPKGEDFNSVLRTPHETIAGAA